MNINYFVIPRDNECPPFAYKDDIFTRDELDLLQRRALASNISGLIGGPKGAGNFLSHEVRRSKISWLPCNRETIWVFDKLSSAISSLNHNFYRFDITGFCEELQLTNYDHVDNGMYGWHIDRGDGRLGVRKLSAVVQLSEPGEYEGGDLEVLHTTPDPIKIEKKRGKLVIFPSYTIHRVTPVTKGTRQSLVAWLFGAPLR